MADRLIAAGYVGMRVRSFAIGNSPNEVSLVTWKWGVSRPAKLTLIDDDGRLSGR
jgi:membrane-associated protease RseP (regulator of RpoE activity)